MNTDMSCTEILVSSDIQKIHLQPGLLKNPSKFEDLSCLDDRRVNILSLKYALSVNSYIRRANNLLPYLTIVMSGCFDKCNGLVQPFVCSPGKEEILVTLSCAPSARMINSKDLDIKTSYVS